MSPSGTLFVMVFFIRNSEMKKEWPSAILTQLTQPVRSESFCCEPGNFNRVVLMFIHFMPGILKAKIGPHLNAVTDRGNSDISR